MTGYICNFFLHFPPFLFGRTGQKKIQVRQLFSREDLEEQLQGAIWRCAQRALSHVRLL